MVRVRAEKAWWSGDGKETKTDERVERDRPSSQPPLERLACKEGPKVPFLGG